MGSQGDSIVTTEREHKIHSLQVVSGMLGTNTVLEQKLRDLLKQRGVNLASS